MPRLRAGIAIVAGGAVDALLMVLGQPVWAAVAGLVTAAFALWWILLQARGPQILAEYQGSLLLGAGEYRAEAGNFAWLCDARRHPRRATLAWEPRNDIEVRVKATMIEFTRRHGRAEDSIRIEWQVRIYDRDLPAWELSLFLPNSSPRVVEINSAHDLPLSGRPSNRPASEHVHVGQTPPVADTRSHTDGDVT